MQLVFACDGLAEGRRVLGGMAINPPGEASSAAAEAPAAVAELRLESFPAADQQQKPDGGTGSSPSPEGAYTRKAARVDPVAYVAFLMCFCEAGHSADHGRECSC